MAYWTASGDPRNDAAKARECREHVAKELAGWESVKEEHRAKFRVLRDAHLSDQTNRAKRRRVRQAIEEWLRLCEQEREMKAFIRGRR